MPELAYHHVDVFTERPFGGNQLAVFTDATDLTTAQMQQIAREMNFSETTFVLPPQDPQNDFRLRIFTPAVELPMAGHPTVGAAYVLQHVGRVALAGGEQTIHIEEGVGTIPVTCRLSDGGLFVEMSQPLPTFGSIFAGRDAIAEMLSVPVEALLADYPLQVVSTGVPFLFVPMTDLAAVRDVKLRADVWERALKDWEAPQVFVFTMETQVPGSTVHSRMFAPAMGVAEDPATGAASGSLGCYLVQHGLVPPADRVTVVSEQGYEMGRPSQITITIDTREGAFTGVRVGGACVYMGRGVLCI